MKALGEGEPGRPWREDDLPAPADPYGISKHEAEQALLAFGRANGIEVAIVRPPLVCGPGVCANFAGLMRAVERGIPLPLGAVDERRSVGLRQQSRGRDPDHRDPRRTGRRCLSRDRSR